MPAWTATASASSLVAPSGSRTFSRAPRTRRSPGSSRSRPTSPEDEARAKGYVKGNLKKDEVIKLLRRVTTPKTIYKKQKLDRDDIVDITTSTSSRGSRPRCASCSTRNSPVRSWSQRQPRGGRGQDRRGPHRPIAYDDDMYTTKIEPGCGLRLRTSSSTLS
jgi:hypothetical protein